MKKTTKINISGIVFQLDEDAYDKLKIYLDLLGGRFGNSAEGKEIIEDIERRIAELLFERTSNQKEAVTLPDVEEVISIMGSPEDFSILADGNEPEAEHHAREEAEDYLHSRRKNRRLYRDTDNSVLGGICSGLSAYFNIDPVILRVLFVVFAFAWGITIILYVILWIIVPPARTAAQRLEMRGEEVTIENIERSVRNEYESVKKNVRKYGKSETYEGARTAIGEMFHVLGIIIKGIGRIMVIVVGLFFILMGFGFMLTFLTGLILTQPFLNNIFIDSNVSLSELASLIFSHSDYQWIMIATTFAVCVPLLALMYAGIKMVVRFKAKDTVVLLSFLGIWIISAVLATSLILIRVKDYSGHWYNTSIVNLKEPRVRTLVIDVNVSKIDSLKKQLKYFESHGGQGVYWNLSRNEYFVKPNFSIFKADSSHTGLIFENWAMGKDRQEARKNGEAMKYSWSQNDTALILDPVYELAKGQPWCMPHKNVDLYLHLGSRVTFTANALNFFSYSDSNIQQENWEEWDNASHMRFPKSRTYEMKEEGLKQVKELK